MAQRTILLLEDDIDGSPADVTIDFALDGQQYAIELNAKHAAQLRDDLAPYIAAGRKSGRAANRNPASASASGDNAKIREWARANGHTVGDRGRIHGSIKTAYAAATSNA